MHTDELRCNVGIMFFSSILPFPGYETCCVCCHESWALLEQIETKHLRVWWRYRVGSRRGWRARWRWGTANTPPSWAGWCGAGKTGTWLHQCHIYCGSPHPCGNNEDKKRFFKKYLHLHFFFIRQTCSSKATYIESVWESMTLWHFFYPIH